MKFQKNLPSILSVLVTGVLWAQPALEILSVEALLPTNGVYAGQEFEGAVIIDLDDPWHINAAEPLDEFSIATELRIKPSENYKIHKIIYPKPLTKQFAFFDEPLAVYEGQVIIYFQGSLTAEAGEVVPLGGTLYYQGCNNQVCLPPQETPFTLEIPILSSTEAVEFRNREYFQARPQPSKSVEDDTFNVRDSFVQKGIVLTFLLIFLGGLGLNLTPCVYPLIPITMSYFGGQSAGKTGRRFLMAILYVLGIAVVNSVLGTLAALTGGRLGSFMTNPVVLIAIAAILVTLSLSMFGVYEFGLPSFLVNLGGGSRRGYFGALLMGLSMGIVAAPCIGPFVIGLLTYVATTGNPLLGFSMFFNLSIGLGVPFIFLAFFSSKIGDLPRSGEWMVGVRIIFGFVLLGMALYFLHPLIPESIYAILFPGYIILSGVYLLLFSKAGESARGFQIFKRLIAIILLVLGTWLLKPEAATREEMSWQPYTPEAYKQALEADKPIIIDFYADWCIPCKELDKITFTDAEVISLSKQFRLLKADLTSGGSAAIQQLVTDYQIKGVPTIIFIDREGNEYWELRVLGFEPPEKFVSKMKQTLEK